MPDKAGQGQLDGIGEGFAKHPFDGWRRGGLPGDFRPAGNGAEVFFYKCPGCLRVEIASDGQRCVRGKVEAIKEIDDIGDRGIIEVGVRADHRMVIRVPGWIDQGRDLAPQLSVGAVLIALPSHVANDAALGVELFDGHGAGEPGHAVGLKEEEELEELPGAALEIIRAVARGRGVVGAACAFHDVVKLTDGNVLRSHEHEMLKQVSKAGAALRLVL